MALRVWLPLNGTLENKGTSDDITYSIASGNSFTSNGKICNNALKLTKIQQILGMTSCMTGAKEISYAFWVKVNTAWSTNWLDGIRWTSTDGTSTATERQEFYENCTLVGTWYKGGAIYGGAFTPGVWTHLAATINYNTGEACLYINGDLKGTTSNVDTTYYCRGDFYIGDNGVDILQNDVRIYDHCLSPKEVKEISQGLMLHYKLDGWSGGAGENILTNSTGNLGNTTDWNGLVTRAEENGYSYLIAKRTDTTSTSRTFCTHTAITNLVNSWAPGEKFTISGYYRVPSNETYAIGGNMFIRWTFTASSSSYNDTGFITPTSLTKDTWIYFSNTYTVPSNYIDGPVNFYLSAFSQGLSTIHWKNIKLEKGDTATNWTPTLSEISVDTTKITDSSGYGNDGTITSTISTQQDSQRYEVSSYLNKKKISCSDGFLTTDDPIFTVSLWFKLYSNITYTAYADLISFTTESYSSQPFRLEICGSPVGRNLMWFRGPSGSTGGFLVGSSGSGWYTLDEWHHVALVSSGNKQYISYFDGKQTNTFNGSAYTWTPTGGVSIGDTIEGTASMNDFRIYASALSAEDILDLYHTSTSIDNSKKLHTFELEEISENILSSSAFEQGGLVDANGTETELTTRLRTFYIPVMPNTSYEIFTNINFQVRGVHFFTENQIWISFVSFFAQTGQFTTPSNCYYIRIPFQKANSDANITLADLGSMGPTLTAMIERINGLSNKAYNINIFNNGITRANHFSVSQKSSIDKSGIIEAADFIEK